MPVKIFANSSATLESRIWLVVIMLILTVGQIGINRQVSNFRSEVERNHRDAVQSRKVETALVAKNQQLLREIERQLTALRIQSIPTRSGAG